MMITVFVGFVVILERDFESCMIEGFFSLEKDLCFFIDRIRDFCGIFRLSLKLDLSNIKKGAGTILLKLVMESYIQRSLKIRVNSFEPHIHVSSIHLPTQLKY